MAKGLLKLREIWYFNAPPPPHPPNLNLTPLSTPWQSWVYGDHGAEDSHQIHLAKLKKL